MQLTPGTRLGPYEITAFIGAGGMGEVYKASDSRLGRTVAIKIITPGVAPNDEARIRFAREARSIAALSHPHICPLFDVGREGESDYLVMEYLDGETLADRLINGRLPLDQALRYAIEIAAALSAAHAAGIVHRDLKPGNIILTKSGAKLLDFGLAKPRPGTRLSGSSDLDTDQPLTGAGILPGTLHYMAPEQLEGRDADARSDIFALGAVLFEMSTGRKAFDGPTQAAVIARVLESDSAGAFFDCADAAACVRLRRPNGAGKAAGLTVAVRAGCAAGAAVARSIARVDGAERRIGSRQPMGLGCRGRYSGRC